MGASTVMRNAIFLSLVKTGISENISTTSEDLQQFCE